MIWLKSASELGKPSRDRAFLRHSRWFLTYNPVISRAGWRKEGKAREKQQSCSDKAIPVFPGEACYGGPSERSKKIHHEEIQAQQIWPPVPFTGLVPAKPKDER